MVDSHGFGDRLRAGRLAADLSQEQLAEQSGLAVRTISDLERNRTRWPHPGSVQRLADALGLAGQDRAEFTEAAGRRLSRPRSTRAVLATGDGVVPRQLPYAVPTFAGRAGELATLSRLLTRPGGTVVITAIGGTGGVGKTALAVHWAQLVAAEFPDGQLYVNLHGFGPSGVPVPPGDAVRILLEGLGVTPEGLPPTEEAQFDLYRSRLVGKRLLLVLDNARDEAQVIPLLPGALTCRVVVTSRNPLAGLTELNTAHSLPLDVLTEAEAWDLLEQRLGPERLHADESATSQIIKASAYLPLALSIVAAHAALRPGLPLAHLVAELAAAPGLDAFTAGEPAADIRAVLSWSYRQLDDDTARAFRLAGLHPGADLDPYAIAALTGTNRDQAAQALEILSDSGLMLRNRTGRYGLHDLLREYARELSVAQDPESERRTALTGLFDFYLHAAYAAISIVFPSDSKRRPRVPLPAAPLPALADHQRAREWLDSELANFVAISEYTTENGWLFHATEMSATLQVYLHIGHHHAEALTIHRHALKAAALAGDHSAEGTAHCGLAALAFRQSQLVDAIEGYEQALRCYEQAGDQAGQVRARHYLSNTYQTQGWYRRAAANLRTALAFYRETGDRVMEGRALYDFGYLYLRLYRIKQATRYLHQALAIYQETGDRRVEAHLVMMIGAADLRLGRYRQAADRLQEALVIMRERSDRRGEVRALHYLGSICLRLGDDDQGVSYLEQAVALSGDANYRREKAEVLGDLGLAQLSQGRHQVAFSNLHQALGLAREFQQPEVTAAVLNSLGKALTAAGQPAQGLKRHTEALTVAVDIGEKYEKAKAQAGLGSAHDALGDRAEAIRYWQLAYDTYVKLGVPEAGEVRALLDS